MKNIAVVGFGVVGGGVCELIDMNSEIIKKRAKEEINIKYICDLRDFPESKFNKIRVDDYNILINDPEVDIIVETMGGRGVALELTKKALCAGKSVVTSNKEVVAYHGDELMALASEHGCKYMFEAAVGGAIPVLRPLAQCLAANNVTKIAGILNGTTNYILTQMYRFGKSYEDALKEAQELGYAERNPSADVDGHDTCRKICILAAIMSQNLISPDKVNVKGISEITSDDVCAAEALGGKLKLLGVAKNTKDGLYAEVAPHFIPAESPLYGIEDVFNGALVSADAAGDVMFYGRGAGKLPTASAVVGDIIDIVMHRNDENPFLPWNKYEKAPVSDPNTCSYLIVYKGTAPEIKSLNSAVLKNGIGCIISEKINADKLCDVIDGIKKSGTEIKAVYKIFE